MGREHALNNAPMSEYTMYMKELKKKMSMMPQRRKTVEAETKKPDIRVKSILV